MKYDNHKNIKCKKRYFYIIVKKKLSKYIHIYWLGLMKIIFCKDD